MTLASLYPRGADAAHDSPALIGGESTVTWGEAQRLTAGLATTLRAHGVARGDRVAVARLKGVESYLAVHGILRAGAVAVPIDPLAPPHHARAVLADADVAAVIGDQGTVAAIQPATVAGPDLRVTVIDGDATAGPSAVSWVEAVAADPAPTVDVRGDDLAYVIYTSGSTGRPKGIVHTHASAMAYAERAAAAHLRPADRVAGISGFHYDMSTLELYAAAHARVPVVVMTEAHLRFPASFVARSCGERVSVWYAVTSMLRQVVERGAVESHDTSSLRSIMFAGEPYPPGALRDLFRAFPRAEIVNVYGPAEVNECSYHVLSRPPVGEEEVPVGAAWPGAESRVVDEDGTEVPDGDLGELWISAPTLMDGYWRQPDLTRARVVPRENGAPDWYATGDLVVRDAGGVLFFRGRTDNQIKLRGMRVELEGVESVVADAPGVAQAVVGPDRPGSDASNLLAAVVLAEGAPFDEGAIRHFCAERLPGAFVPRQFDVHDRFPLTTSGKIDRSAVRQQMTQQPGFTPQ